MEGLYEVTSLCRLLRVNFRSFDLELLELLVHLVEESKANGATAESSPALASATSQQWFVAWRWSWWWWSSSRPQRWLSLTPPNATWDTACTEDSQDTASQDSALEATEATAMDPTILTTDPTTDR
nr:uncharacterized protein LOC113813794 [Penaeus vannamei]